MAGSMPYYPQHYVDTSIQYYFLAFSCFAKAQPISATVLGYYSSAPASSLDVDVDVSTLMRSQLVSQSMMDEMSI
jgi:hypothetical protein